MPSDRVQDLASTPAVTIEMAAAARPAFCHPRVGNPQVSSTPQCAGSREAMMNPGQLDALAGGADVGRVRLCGRDPLGTAVGLRAAKEVRQ